MSDTLDSRDLEEQLNNLDTDNETKEAIKELKEGNDKLTAEVRELKNGSNG